MLLGLNAGFVTDSRCRTLGDLLNLSISYLISETKMMLQSSTASLLENLQNGLHQVNPPLIWWVNYLLHHFKKAKKYEGLKN